MIRPPQAVLSLLWHCLRLMAAAQEAAGSSGMTGGDHDQAETLAWAAHHCQAAQSVSAGPPVAWCGLFLETDAEAMARAGCKGVSAGTM